MRRNLRLLVALASSVLVGCASETPFEAPSKPTFLIDSHCFQRASADCHGTPVFGGYTIPWDGGGAWSCDRQQPFSCVPRQMTASELAKFWAAMARVSASGQCGTYRNYILGRHARGRITVYDWDDGDYGDAHWDADPYFHLNMYRAFGSEYQLARTLIHEAWHALNHNTDEGFAESWGAICSLP